MTCQPWVTIEEILDGCAGLDVTSADLEGIVALTSELMYAWSGRQFPGLCPVETVRPYQVSNQGCGSLDWFVGAGWSTTALSLTTPEVAARFGPCAGSCCSTRIRLPGPIHVVVQIDLDGEILDPARWRATRRYVERIDGDFWPCSQDLSRDLDQPNTFAVVYQRGAPLPEGGRFAARKLAVEIARANCGQDCAMSPAVTSAVMEGLSYTYEANSELQATSRSGIREVDDWLRAVNPKGRQRRAAAFRADARNRTARG